MKILFIFLDGIGLGENNAEINPLARAEMPTLEKLLGGRKLLAESAPFHGEHASLLALDACLNVDGLPQSATGQAVLVTGRNIPQEIGEHYGPKPNDAVREAIDKGNIFKRLKAAEKKSALLVAYPPPYFKGIDSGKRLLSSIPYAVTSAGLKLFTQEDYVAGDALTAEFTGAGWRDYLKIKDIPSYTPQEAGKKLFELALRYDFSFFEYWMSDHAGHHQDWDSALMQLEMLDGVLQGLEDGRRETGDGGRRTEDGDELTANSLQLIANSQLLILITSDHGNMEDLSTRRHTLAKVPGLLIGNKSAREKFADGLVDLTGIAGAIERVVIGK